jgi:hypothetical protein
MLVRREGPVACWIAKSLIATFGAALAATLLSSASVATAATSHHESPSNLLNDACGATLAASAFRAHGHAHTGGTSISVDVYFGSAGELLTLTQHGNQTVHAIINGPSTYIKGNGPFWRSATNNAGVASLLAGRWIDMTSDKKDMASLTKDINKRAILSQCGEGGSATYAGKGVVNGVKVTKVHQNANNESNTYYIEVPPTPRILRVTGNPDEKNSGDLVFSNYGVQPDTTAPAGATPISQFQ